MCAGLPPLYRADCSVSTGQIHNRGHSDPSTKPLTMGSAIGLFIYVSLLLVNAIAILNEERFLARGTFRPDCGLA